MRGTILSYDSRTHRGTISGYDGDQYEFVMLDWRGSPDPRANGLVDFDIELGRARNIVPSEVRIPEQGWLSFLFSANGRISRKQYWLRYLLPLVGIYFLAGFLDEVLINKGGTPAPPVFRSLASLFFLVPNFAVPAKRLHDRGLSGWWAAFGYTPIVILAVAAYWYYSTRMKAAGDVAVEPTNPLLVAALLMVVALAAFWWIHLAINVMFLRGQPGENLYGPDPLPPPDRLPENDRSNLISYGVSAVAVVAVSLAGLISALHVDQATPQTTQAAFATTDGPPTPSIDDALIKQKSDAGMRELMNFPLAGMLIREVPGAEDQIREAVDDFARATNDAASLAAIERSRNIIVSLRKQHVTSALKRAPDIDIVRIWRAQGVLAEHLSQTDLKLCREFAEGGIRDLAILDQRTKKLFLETLKATEIAFLSGRDPFMDHQILEPEEAVAELTAAGFTPADFQVFADLATHSDGQVCEVTVKMYTATLQLPEENAVALMRWAFVQQ